MPASGKAVNRGRGVRLFQAAPGGDDLVSAGCRPFLGVSENVVGDLGWEGENPEEGLLGVFEVATSHTEEEGGGGEDSPSLLAEGVGEGRVLSFFLIQGVGEAGVASEAYLDHPEGGEGTQVGGPVRVREVEEGFVVVYDEDVWSQFVAFAVGVLG